MQSYEIKAPVVVELNVTGETHRHEFAVGTVTPKNEDEERALASLAESNPAVCALAKSKPTKPTKE